MIKLSSDECDCIMWAVTEGKQDRKRFEAGEHFLLRIIEEYKEKKRLIKLAEDVEKGKQYARYAKSQ